MGERIGHGLHGDGGVSADFDFADADFARFAALNRAPRANGIYVCMFGCHEGYVPRARDRIKTLMRVIVARLRMGSVWGF